MRICPRPARTTRNCGARSGLSSKAESGLLNHPLQLGPYQIVGLSARAGWAQFTQARDTRLGRHGRHQNLGGAVQRAVRTRGASRGGAEPSPDLYALRRGPDYLVMELLEGEPLLVPCRCAQGAASGRSRWRMRLMRRIASIVHRDLKPGTCS